jgi:hypothetical protein
LHIPPKESLSKPGTTLDFPPELQRACARINQEFGNGDSGSDDSKAVQAGVTGADCTKILKRQPKILKILIISDRSSISHHEPCREPIAFAGTM